MRRMVRAWLAAVVVAAGGVAAFADPALPPVAAARPTAFTAHGHTRIDPYDWLKRRTDPEVIAYLKAENDYAEEKLAPLAPLAADLQAEMRDGLGDATELMPIELDGWTYRLRYAKGADYPVIERSRGARREVVLDVPRLAEGQRQFFLRNWTVSPDGARVAYAVDATGNNEHRILVRTIATGRLVDDLIERADSDIVFSADGRYLFYVWEQQVWRHMIGADAGTDVLVHEERDDTFSLSLGLTKSRRYVLITAEHTGTTEVRYLAADRPTGEFAVMAPRRRGVRYFVDHLDGRFYVHTNLDAPDYRVMVTGEDAPGPANWRGLVAERPGHFVSGVEVFRDFLALEQVHEAAGAVRLVRLKDMRARDVRLPARIGAVRLDPLHNLDPAARTVRFAFESPRHPKAVYRADPDTGRAQRLHQSLPGERFVQRRYATRQIRAVAADGAEVPVTVVYRRDLKRRGGNPTLVTGYGAYGASSLPGFQTLWYGLIDRGFVLAIAHVRGGRERGQRWYEDGRLAAKANTFTDFIAATEALIARGYADRRKVLATGASAGGLVMGAVANLRPDLFAGIVAEVPFVDVVTSMSDPTVPLTRLEYDEWGDPAARAHYEAMLAYSPYDRVAPQRYPPMLVTAAIDDTQVDYREAAKWVAKLRATRTDDNELLLLTDFASGHVGDSGRLRWMAQQARLMAWMLARVK